MGWPSSAASLMHSRFWAAPVRNMPEECTLPWNCDCTRNLPSFPADGSPAHMHRDSFRWPFQGPHATMLEQHSRACRDSLFQEPLWPGLSTTASPTPIMQRISPLSSPCTPSASAHARCLVGLDHSQKKFVDFSIVFAQGHYSNTGRQTDTWKLAWHIGQRRWHFSGFNWDEQMHFLQRVDGFMHFKVQQT